MISLGAALLLVTPLPLSQEPGASQDSVTLASRINGFVQPYATSSNFTGVILVRQHGRVAFTHGYGMASHELGVRNTPESRFHIASVSKAFTAAAVLLLEERGKLSSSDAVGKRVPDYPGGEKILIEHLLKHTSGIPNLGSQPEWAREERMSHDRGIGRTLWTRYSAGD